MKSFLCSYNINSKMNEFIFVIYRIFFQVIEKDLKDEKKKLPMNKCSLFQLCRSKLLMGLL